MRYVYWARARTGRFLIILLAIITYFFLLMVDALYYFPHFVSNNSSSWLPWMRFGFSSFVALLFLAVGTLVCLYARNRRVALLLFSFSCSMMVAFVVQTGAQLGDSLLSAFGGLGSVLSLFLLSVLLLLFPKDFLSLPWQSHLEQDEGKTLSSHFRHFFILLVPGYLIILSFLAIIGIVRTVFYYVLPSPVFNVLSIITYIYAMLALIGILVTIIVSYRQSSSLRERQQRRLFVSGVILAVAPLLLLTVLPQALNLPKQYIVDSQLSTLTVGLFPLALGYTILRYQVLVFDMYIRRAVAWIVGVVGLAVLGYLVITLSSLLLYRNVTAYVVCVVAVMAVLGPCTWWLAQAVTERLFFSEILHYRRLIDNPDIIANETFDLNEASRLLTLTILNAFETQEVCLFVLDEDSGYYRLYPPLKENDPDSASRRPLVQRVLSAVRPSTYAGDDQLEANELLIKRVAGAPRPLVLSEATRSDEELPSGLARYFATTSSLRNTEPLLAPVRAQGKIIGVLVLGERGDHQQYAGPDFEAIHLILSRFSPVLETARLYEKASRHTAILNTLYSASTMPIKAFETIEVVVTAYTRIVAEAVRAGAEIWLYHEQDGLLHRVIHEGTGPQLVHQDHLAPSQERDWSSCYYEGDSSPTWQDSSIQFPPCLPQAAYFPFAWIPLNRAQQHLGILALTYPRPHLFSDQEMRVLEMFASQCAVALENARITLELRTAYERQKELDRLKDQFIITASHELRTPLTAVQGYIELLATYNLTLEPGVRADFIARAHRGCDELTLMVGNIMDASHVQIDAENIRLSPVSLTESVQHVLGILEALTRREQRTIQVDIPADALVMGDSLRLRQVLLNLVSNALKYSPVGSVIEISLDRDDEQITLRVHDHGLGVPLEDQERLFERFVRLERDMNSPVRGAGLGLYISKQLIEAMGGRIWVESTGIPGGGSVFAFTLKRSKVGEKPQGLRLEHQEV